MLRKRWVKWTLASLAILLVAAGTARSIRVKRALDTLERLESQDAAQYAAAVEHQQHHAHMDAHMDAHMKWTAERKPTVSDEARAEQIVETLRDALAPYRDYKAAVRAGYFPFAPDVPQRMMHFTHAGRAVRNAFRFDPAEPTSLLYRKGERGFELIGVMYTAPRRMTEAQLNERVPVSIGKWHQHVNLCLPPAGTPREQADWSRFGPAGSIASKRECNEAQGRWRPQIFGWMVHVHPYETTREKIWTH